MWTSPPSNTIVAGGRATGVPSAIRRSQPEPLEGGVERAPVLEVDGAAKLLGKPCRRPAPALGADRFVPGLEVMDSRCHEYRERARDHQVIEVPVRVLDQPLPFFVVDHLALLVAEDTGGARVDDEQPRIAEVTVEGPSGCGRLAIPSARPLPQTRAGVGIALHVPEQFLLGELGRREIADVLVDPVGHEGAGDAGVPPGRAAHLGDPGPGDVPVVVDVVVVEDHHARDRREQPADLGVGPRLTVELRVFLEVRNLVAGGLAHVAPGTNELRGRR